MDKTETNDGGVWPASDANLATEIGINSEQTVSRDQNKRPWETFMYTIRHDNEYRVRCLHTVFVMWLFITSGIAISMLGGAFPDLRLIINKDLQTASWIYTAGSFGNMIGALSSGYLFDRWKCSH
ncbi:hypothetical protein ACF0H5_018001 [Mactra antiquata]